MESWSELLDKKVREFIDDEHMHPRFADAIIEMLQENGLTAKELYQFLDSLTFEYEVRMLGSHTGRIVTARECLGDRIVTMIEWENLSREEILELVRISGSSIHYYHDQTVAKAVKSGKLSVEDMMTLVDSGKLPRSCNKTLIAMIQSGRLTEDQVLKVVKASSYHWSVVLFAIKTKFFSKDQMSEMYEKSFRDPGVAKAISELS